MPKRANGEGTFQELPSGKIRLRVSVDVDGIVVRKSFTGRNKTECRRARDAWLQSEQKVAVEKVKTVRQYAEHWLAVYNTGADITVRDYKMYLENHILPFKLTEAAGKELLFGDLRIINVRSSHIARIYSGCKNEKGDPLSLSALKKIRTVLKDLFDKAAGDRVYPQEYRNPVDGVKLPEKKPAKIVTLNREHATVVAEYTKQHSSGPYIALLLHTGMRVGELLGLQWEQVNEDDRVIEVSNHLIYTAQGETVVPGTKTNQIRFIPYGEDLQQAIARIPRTGPFVVSRKRKGVYTHHTHTSFETIYYKFWDDLNATLNEPIPRITPHKLRHTFATYLLRSDVDSHYVKTLLGHTTIATTQIYEHADIGDLRKQMERLKY